MKHTPSQRYLQPSIVTSPLSYMSLNVSELPSYHIRHMFLASNTHPHICGTHFQPVSILVLNIRVSYANDGVPFSYVQTVKHFPPTIKLTHFMTKNLKPIIIHDARNILFQQQSFKINTYRYMYRKTTVSPTECQNKQFEYCL